MKTVFPPVEPTSEKDMRETDIGICGPCRYDYRVCMNAEGEEKWVSRCAKAMVSKWEEFAESCMLTARVPEKKRQRCAESCCRTYCDALSPEP